MPGPSGHGTRRTYSTGPVKTFWLRLFILLAVPVVLIYEKKHVDWATTFISVWLFAVVIAGYMLWHLYATAKALDAERQTEFDGLLKHGVSLAEEVDRLSWPENRPILIFDHWGEVPHDDPRASFLEVTEYRKEREYWERGIFLLNRGGDAHEIDVMPIEIAKGVETRSSYIARIDAGSTGFAFIGMDYQKNVRFKGDDNVWDLPRNMAAIEDKLNAVNIAEGRLAVEVGVRYRDANHAWCLSLCTMEYRREQNKSSFITPITVSLVPKNPSFLMMSVPRRGFNIQLAQPHKALRIDVAVFAAR